MSGLQAKTIVAPIDFSDESLEALGATLDIASSPSDVHAVHVISEFNPADLDGFWGRIDNSVRVRRAADMLRKQVSDKNNSQIQIDVEVGDPGRRVADFAKRIGADLIVMASRGRTGLSHMLHGSVAEQVMRLSHCPVLVLRNSSRNCR
jgi:nucleotide-binding universal stress UspA family protein